MHVPTRSAYYTRCPRPLPGFALVELLPPPDATASGLVLVQSDEDITLTGRIVACGGPGPDGAGGHAVPEAAVGDRVLLQKGTGWTILVGESATAAREHRLVRHESVIAVVAEDADVEGAFRVEAV